MKKKNFSFNRERKQSEENEDKDESVCREGGENRRRETITSLEHGQS